MRSRLATNGVMAMLVMVGIAAPFAILYQVNRAAKEEDAAASRQKIELEELAKDNAALSKRVLQATAATLSEEQMRELLKLRAEAGALRRQRNDLEKLREANHGSETRRGSGQELTPEARAELSSELLNAARNILAELPDAQRRFATKNDGEAARSLPELRRYFPAVDGRRMPGLYSFQFVREDGPKAGDTLILREESIHETSDKQNAKIYGFADGQTVEVKTTAGEDSDKFFEDWEKQRLNPALTQGQ